MTEVVALKAQLAKLEANLASTKGTNNKSSKNNNSSNNAKKIPAWKKVAPGAGESQVMVKTINDKKKTFNWCPHHQMWTIHLPKDCTYKKEGGDNSNANAADQQKLTLNKALMGFLQQDIEE